MTTVQLHIIIIVNDKEIEYSKQFDWVEVVKNHYIPNMKNIIKNRYNKVAICFIGTGKYVNFLPDYYQHIEEHFLPNSEKTFLVFTDGELEGVPDNVIQYHQNHLDWPFITSTLYLISRLYIEIVVRGIVNQG